MLGYHLDSTLACQPLGHDQDSLGQVPIGHHAFGNYDSFLRRQRRSLQAEIVEKLRLLSSEQNCCEGMRQQPCDVREGRCWDHPMPLQLPDAGGAVLRGSGQPAAGVAPAAAHPSIRHPHIQRNHEPVACITCPQASAVAVKLCHPSLPYKAQS